jgi:hypothetical protein
MLKRFLNQIKRIYQIQILHKKIKEKLIKMVLENNMLENYYTERK